MALGIQYPDSGQPYEDASVLANAIFVTTAQRARMAQILYDEPLKAMTVEARGQIAIEAFMKEMLATEDTIGWLFVLRDWKPGTVKGSLIFLLDGVKVGRAPFAESDAVRLLDEAAKPEALRKLMHIPPAHELERSGIPKDISDRLETALPNWGEGMRRVAELRRSERRARVIAYNKLKHMILAMPFRFGSEVQIVIPGGFKLLSDGIHIQSSIQISTDASHIRNHLARAIAMQAVLHNILALIWMTRFGGDYRSPPWVSRALELDGWYEEPGGGEA